jgi:hypothetical protein
MKRNSPSETNRFLAQIERQIADQNALLRDAVENHPEFAARFRSVFTFAPVARTSPVTKWFGAVRA